VVTEYVNTYIYILYVYTYTCRQSFIAHCTHSRHTCYLSLCHLYTSQQQTASITYHPRMYNDASAVAYICNPSVGEITHVSIPVLLYYAINSAYICIQNYTIMFFGVTSASEEKCGCEGPATEMSFFFLFF